MNKTSYHNTVPASGPELASAEKAAQAEEEQVLALFRGFPCKEFSPCAVWRLLAPESCVTNWRRAITNLTTKKKLIKTGNKVTGFFNRTVNTWQLRVEKPEQKSLF